MDFEHGRTARSAGDPKLRKGGWEPAATVPDGKYYVQRKVTKHLGVLLVMFRLLRTRSGSGIVLVDAA
jgi:hypothetical protein